MSQKVIGVRLAVDLPEGEAADQAIADICSVLVDALGEFQFARGKMQPGGHEAYVAKRYEGQSEKFCTEKLAQVARRCVLAANLQHAVFANAEVRVVDVDVEKDGTP